MDSPLIVDRVGLRSSLAPEQALTVIQACEAPEELRTVYLPLFAGVGLYENPAIDEAAWRGGKLSFRGRYYWRDVPTHLALEAERDVILGADSSPEVLREAACNVAARTGVAFTFHTLLTTMYRRLEAAGVPALVRARLIGSPAASTTPVPWRLQRDAIDLLSYRKAAALDFLPDPGR